MARVYSATEQAVHPVTLTDKTYADIGRLIRAFAEIEDLVTLYICQLTQLSHARAVILLGRTAITRRVEMAEYLAQTTGTKIAALHAHIFNADYREALECRNAVAHGTLLGGTDDGALNFLTSKTEAPDGDKTIQVAIGFHPDTIAAHARRSQLAVGRIEKALKLEAQRASRLQKTLLPHRKAQPQRAPSAKPERPPKPSKG